MRVHRGGAAAARPGRGQAQLLEHFRDSTPADRRAAVQPWMRAPSSCGWTTLSRQRARAAQYRDPPHHQVRRRDRSTASSCWRSSTRAGQQPLRTRRQRAGPAQRRRGRQAPAADCRGISIWTRLCNAWSAATSRLRSPYQRQPEPGGQTAGRPSHDPLQPHAELWRGQAPTPTATEH